MLAAYQRMMASAATVMFWRSVRLSTGTMSQAEFNRMVREKPFAFAGAAAAATGVLLHGGSSAKAAHASIAQLSRRVRANSRRLTQR